VEYIHDTRWSLAKCIFLTNRYFLLVLYAVTTGELFLPTPSDSFCMTGIQFTVAGTVVITAVIGVSLAQRVYAFWDRNRMILIGLAILYGLCVVSSVVSVAIVFHVVTVIPKPGTFPPGCITAHKDFWAALVPSIIYDTVIVVLTVVRAHQLGVDTRTPIISHLYRTGVGYFSVMLFSNVFVAASFASPMVLTVVVVPANLTASLASIMCSRMLLYIRAELQEHQQQPHSVSAIELSQIFTPVFSDLSESPPSDGAERTQAQMALLSAPGPSTRGGVSVEVARDVEAVGELEIWEAI